MSDGFDADPNCWDMDGNLKLGSVHTFAGAVPRR
jgi:hypothetical protein